MSDFSRAITDFVTEALTQSSVIEPTTLTDRFIRAYPELVDAETERLVRAQVRREIITRTKVRPEDTGQLALFPGIPAAICVDKVNECYVARDRATWLDLMAGRRERVDNIANAEKSLALYDDDLERLRPYMEDEPDVTVADAVRAMDDEVSR